MKINLSGQRFEKLLVISESKTSFGDKLHDRSIRWLCKCDCGKEVIIASKYLRKGDNKSCGCTSNFSGYKQLTKSYFNNIKRSAIARNIEFNITPEYIWKIFEKQNQCCALSGFPIQITKKHYHKIRQTASLDRIDSSKGYVEGNVQWVHKDINYMKNDFTEDEFCIWIKRIYEYKKLG